MELSPRNSPLIERKTKGFELDQRDIDDLKKFCSDIPELEAFISADATATKKEVRSVLSEQIKKCNLELKAKQPSCNDYIKLFIVNGLVVATLLKTVFSQDDGKILIGAMGIGGAMASGLVCLISDRVDARRLSTKKEILQKIINKLPKNFSNQRNIQ
jgi:hypothetical protein